MAFGKKKEPVPGPYRVYYVRSTGNIQDHLNEGYNAGWKLVTANYVGIMNNSEWAVVWDARGPA